MPTTEPTIEEIRVHGKHRAAEGLGYQWFPHEAWTYIDFLLAEVDRLKAENADLIAANITPMKPTDQPVPAEAARQTCVECGHKNVNARGICVEGLHIDPLQDQFCGCKCEFPAPLGGGEPELQPCPFCGSHAHIEQTGKPDSYSPAGYFTVCCVVCDATIDYRCNDPDEAAERWNSRARASQPLPSDEASGLVKQDGGVQSDEVKLRARAAAEEIVNRCLVYFADLDGDPRMSAAAPKSTAEAERIIIKHFTASDVDHGGNK